MTCTPNCLGGTYGVTARPLTASSLANVSFTNVADPCRRAIRPPLIAQSKRTVPFELRPCLPANLKRAAARRRSRTGTAHAPPAAAPSRLFHKMRPQRGRAGGLQIDRRFVCYGLTRSTSGIGLSGAAVAISRLKRSVVPSNIHPPPVQREAVSIDFPSRTRSAFAVASRSAR